MGAVPASHAPVDTTGTAGWAVLDGCSTPILTIPHAAADGTNLEDVAMNLEEWTPSP
jgi:hypothetical protein